MNVNARGPVSVGDLSLRRPIFLLGIGVAQKAVESGRQENNHGGEHDMKAIRFHQHGGPEVLKYEDAPEPKILANEVLVRVKACALNHLDVWLRLGVPGWKLQMPHIVGSDISGEVAEVGALVTRVKPRDRVLLSPGISCGQCEACFQGLDSACRQYTLFGVFVEGGYAEYVKSPEMNVMPIPRDLSFDEAAAVPLVFITAWHMLFTRAGLRPGEEVLVIGAGSGVGSAAIQIAKLVNARVIATAGADWKLERARALGADEVINHTRQSIAEEVRRLTHKRGVDVVVDHVGAAVWEACFDSLATYGRLVTCGMTTGADLKLNGQALYGRQRTILGSFMGGKAELVDALKFIAPRKLKPVIDSAFPLADAAAAQQKMESREFFGKILLHP
jgi:NADPH:quinone reductase-like Zn-dependent oxidoreductase